MQWYDQGKAVPDPSLAEFQTWQHPRDLIAHLKGPQARSLVNGLLQRLENGFLFAAAGISSWRDEKGALQKRFAPVSIQADWWQDADGAREYWQTLWTLGDVNVRLYDISRGEFIPIALTAIRFEASSLYDDLTIPRPASASRIDHVSAILEDPGGSEVQQRLSARPKTAVEALSHFAKGAQTPAPPAEESSVDPGVPNGHLARIVPLDDPQKHAGGRPRKDFWEPLLVAAGIAIYAGFQPQRIADVERWMTDWLTVNGYEAGEVAIRQRARLLFNAYSAEQDKN